MRRNLYKIGFTDWRDIHSKRNMMSGPGLREEFDPMTFIFQNLSRPRGWLVIYGVLLIVLLIDLL